MDVYTDFTQFANIRSKIGDGTDDALKETALQFEALFIQSLMKNMRNTEIGEDLFSNDNTKFYQQMYDQQLSVELGRNGQIGMADMIIRQLAGQYKTDDENNTSVQNSGSLDMPVSVSFKKEVFSDPESFIEHMKPLAVDAAKKIGVSPDVLVAQAALETGWGSKIMHDQSGNNSHNLFGIKSANGWAGVSVHATTLEFESGSMKPKTEAFRSYVAYEASFSDYADFITGKNRYDLAVKSAADSEAYVEGLQAAGYATDPEYANKINRILQGKYFSSL